MQKTTTTSYLNVYYVLSTPVSPISREFPPTPTSSAVTALLSFTQVYTSLPSLSRTKVDYTLVGNVEKKGNNQWSPTRRSNIAPTATTFAFPLPPTQIRPAPAEVVQEARNVARDPAESSRQRFHNPIENRFSSSTLRPTTHARTDFLASAPPPLPSIGRSRSLSTSKSQPATPLRTHHIDENVQPDQAARLLCISHSYRRGMVWKNRIAAPPLLCRGEAGSGRGPFAYVPPKFSRNISLVLPEIFFASFSVNIGTRAKTQN